MFKRVEPGGDILDVGTGCAQFTNTLALSGCFRSVTTIDPARYKKYTRLTDDYRRLDVSITESGLTDNSFDSVVCMEVLEHVPDEIFMPAIDELRRVCRGHLLITVPYKEPEPIHPTHRRRFDDIDLQNLFPTSHLTVLRRPERSWILIEEYPNGYPSTPLGVLATENEALLVRVNELEGEVALLEERVDNLKNRKALLEERVDNLKNRKALLEERVDNLKNRKALLEERVDNLQNRKALLEERVDNLKNRKALRAADWVGATRRRLSRK